MVLNDVVVLGVVCVFIVDTLIPVLEWLNWGNKDESSSKSAQPEAHSPRGQSWTSDWPRRELLTFIKVCL